MNTEKVLLTGGGGLVGRTIAPLLARSYSVTHLDLKDPDDGLPFIQGDLRDSHAVAEACKGMDSVLHVAALHGKAWAAAGDDTGFEVNVIGCKNILEGAAKAGVRRVVFTSSIWATGHGDPPPEYLPIDEELPRRPIELYGLTKQLGEEMCAYASALYGLSVIVLRPGGIRPAESYGPLQSGFLFGAVDVRDVARAHLLALELSGEVGYETFVITADSPLRGIEPDEYFADPVGTLEKVVPGSAAAVEAGKITLPEQAEWYSISKAEKYLGYRPQYNFISEII